MGRATVRQVMYVYCSVLVDQISQRLTFHRLSFPHMESLRSDELSIG